MEFSLKISISFLITTLMAICFLTNLFSLARSYEQKDLILNSIEIPNNDQINQLPRPSLKISEIKLALNSNYNLLDYVIATDQIDGNLKNNVKIYDNIDITQRGIYLVRFSVTNSSNMTTNQVVKARVD